MKIAIDGPSGAGKSTIAKILAERLGIIYLDTGAMYRAVGLKVFESGLDISDHQKIEEMLGSIKIEIIYSEGSQKVILDGRNVSADIRQHHISKLASDVSALKAVRLKMVEMQREIASRQDCVLDGRDIGTYVLPDADYKFYLTASLDERARRRYLELVSKGGSPEPATVKEDIRKRDYNDMNRDFAPLKKADDAIEIDSSSMNIEEVTRKIMSYIDLSYTKY